MLFDTIAFNVFQMTGESRNKIFWITAPNITTRVDIGFGTEDTGYFASRHF